MIPSRSALYDAFDAPPAEAVDFVCAVTTSHGSAAPKRVLDLGCRTGRLLGEYARRSMAVVGLEPDADYRAAAHARSCRGAQVRGGGFGDLDEVEAFDVVAAMNGPFGYIERLEDRADALVRAYRALVPGGVLVIDVANFVSIFKAFRPNLEEVANLDGRIVKRTRHHAIDAHDALFCSKESHFWADDPRAEPFHVTDHRFAIITLPEIAYFARIAGFEDVRTYNGYSSRASEELSGSRLLVSTRRPL